MTYSIDFSEFMDEACSDAEKGDNVLVNMYSYNDYIFFEEEANKIREIIDYFAMMEINIYMYNLREDKKGRFMNYKNIKFID